METKEKQILLNLEELIHQRIIGQEEAVRGQVHRAQLGVGLVQEAFGIPGHLEDFPDILHRIGQHRRRQGQEVGRQDHRPIQEEVGDGQLELAVGRLFHLGLAVQIEADEDDPQFPGLFIEQFLFPVGPHIPVEDKDIHVGVDPLQFDGGFH